MAAEEKRSLHLLQVLRGVAALLVVIHHATGIPSQMLGTTQPQWLNGAAGVDIFFVISGFVMALSSRSLARSLTPATEFMKRRLERIVPLYWIFTTLKVALVLSVPRMALHGMGGGLWHLVASYLFIPSLNFDGTAQPVLAVGWTLNFEMLFYVLFATALALKIKPLRLLVPLLGIVACVAPFLHKPVGALNWFDPIVLEFVFGMLLYEAYQRRRLLPTLVAWAALAAGFAVILSLVVEGQMLLRPWVWGLAALAIVAAGISLETTLGPHVPAWMMEIGDASYSIYLTHTFALPLLGVVLKHQHHAWLRGMLPVILMSLALSLIVGDLTYRWVERPIINFFRQRRLSGALARA